MVQELQLKERISLNERGDLMNLTKEQIENWRKVLFGMFGSYARLMSDEQILAYAQNMQSHIDSQEFDEEGEEV